MFLKLTAFFPVFYIVITILQFIAALDGIMHIFGLHWIFAGFAAVFLALMPAIGPMAGLYGAVAVWKWNIWLALFLFFWPYFILFGFFLFGTTSALLFWKKAVWPFYPPHPFRSHRKDIEPDFTVKESAPEEEAGTLYIEYTDKSGK